MPSDREVTLETPNDTTVALRFLTHDHHCCELTLDRIYKYKLLESVAPRRAQAETAHLYCNIVDMMKSRRPTSLEPANRRLHTNLSMPTYQ